MKTERTVQQENQRRANNRIFQNYITTARGTPVNEGDGESYTYGYTDVAFWNPTTQMWDLVNDADKFLVTESDYDTASQIFWDRWASYCKRRFNRNFVKIERI